MCQPMRIMTKKTSLLVAGVILTLCGVWVIAEEIYQQPTDFVSEAFDGDPPEQRTFWITKTLRPQVDKIMKHRYSILKVRYWKKGERSVWILDEIGKTKPITTGCVVDSGRMAYLNVLIYRESHGWEVRREAFRSQFKTATLVKGHRLSVPIDGITGATMSVNAVKNIARLALFLDRQVAEADPEDQSEE